MDPKLKELIDDLSDYHPPADDEQRAKYERIAEASKVFMGVIAETCPCNPDSISAIRDVRNARMWANASMACKTGGLIRW